MNQIDTESCFCPNVTEYKSMDSMIHMSVDATETETAYQQMYTGAAENKFTSTKEQ